MRKARRRRARSLAFVVVTSLFSAFILASLLKSPASAQAAGAAGLRIIRSDASGVVFEFNVPSYQLSRREVDGERYEVLSAEGLEAWSEAEGAPLLPMRGVLVGAPQGAQISVHVLAQEVEELPQRIRLLPSPTTQIERPALETRRYRNSGVKYERNPEAYGRDAFTPEATARLGAMGYMRSQRFAQISLHPFQYNAAQGRARWVKQMRVEVRFSYPDGMSVKSLGVFQDEGGYERILEKQLLNYESARGWRLPRVAAAGAEREAVAAGEQYRISIRGDGIYRLTYGALISAGVSAGVDPRTFKIKKNGGEIPIYVSGESDGVFNPSDYVEFYGQGINTIYSDVNVYWLSAGGANGSRMGTRNVPPGGGMTPSVFRDYAHFEENHYYIGDRPRGNGDHWYWNPVATFPPPNPFWVQSPAVYTLTLPDVSSLLTATLRARVFGAAGAVNAAVPHHVVLYVNGNMVADDTWVGDVDRQITVQVPQAYLVSGDNVLTLTLPNDTGLGYDAVAVNWFEVDYDRRYKAYGDYLAFAGGVSGAVRITVTNFITNDIALYDVTSPTSVVRLTGASVVPSSGYALSFSDTPGASARYVAAGTRKTPLGIARDPSASDLRSAANGADEIIITYDDFYTATEPLANLRASQGLRVARVRISDVYDEFSDGVFDPTAIRSFLSYAYANWQAPAPLYVLLVGDGNLNYRNYTPNNIGPLEQQFIPPYLDAVDIWLNETATDNRYVTIVGADIAPDMAIGRLPVSSVSETTAIVGKIVSYEQNPPAGGWRGVVGFYTDNYYTEVGGTDPAGNFYNTAEGIHTGHIPSLYTITRAYYNPYLPQANSTWYYTTTEGERYAVTSTLSAGVLFANYIGHAGRNYWAAEGILANEGAAPTFPNSFASVNNGGRTPIVLELTCWTGAFQFPADNTLAESFIRAEGRGSVASWASTGLSVNQGHDILARAFYDGVFAGDLRRIGLAINFSKAQMVGYGYFPDIVEEFTLFGDPAMQIQTLPVADLSLWKSAASADGLAPGAPVTFTLQLSNTGLATATGVVITDILPVGLVSPTFAFSGAAITPTGSISYVWRVADVAPGAVVTLTVYARAGNYFFDNQVYTLVNTATVATTMSEIRAFNNTSAATLTHSPADVVVSKSATSTKRLYPSGAVTFTIAYTNVGGTVATGVMITDILPSGLVSPSFAYSGAAVTVVPGSPYVWTVSDLQPNQGGVITIWAMTDHPPLVNGAVILTNTATITTTRPEVSAQNNHSSVTLTSQSVYLPIIMR